MEIVPIARGSALWDGVASYAQGCSWSAGPGLARAMSAGEFSDWERVFVALEGNEIAGYLTFSRKDCIPDVEYTPFIGYVFVGEPHRGRRLSQRMINAAMDYARGLGFDRVYIVSDHVNLYEKYGFVAIDERPAPWNPDTMETIFVQAL